MSLPRHHTFKLLHFYAQFAENIGSFTILLLLDFSAFPRLGCIFTNFCWSSNGGLLIFSLWRRSQNLRALPKRIIWCTPKLFSEAISLLENSWEHLCAHYMHKHTYPEKIRAYVQNVSSTRDKQMSNSLVIGSKSVNHFLNSDS